MAKVVIELEFDTEVIASEAVYKYLYDLMDDGMLDYTVLSQYDDDEDQS